MMTSPQINYGGRPPYWKLSFGYIGFIVRLTRNLVRRSKMTLRHRSPDQNTKCQKFKMAVGRHIENGYITISQMGIFRFQWNLAREANFKFWFQERSHEKIANFFKFKMADGRHLKWFYSYISASDRPNSTKFAMQKQSLIPTMVTWQKTL